MRRIRFGIIGCGSIANHSHLQDLATIPEAELVACADVREDAARSTAERWGAGTWISDYHALLSRGDVEAVIVATPHPTHAAIGVDVLASGKHLMVQKPLTTRRSDADRFVEEAQECAQAVMCLPYNWNNAYREALRLLASGAIGRICQIRRRVAHGGPPRDSWFYSPDVAEFGALFDMGVYAVSGITGLAGPAVTVSGLVRSFEPGVRIDDNAVVQLEFANGAIGSAETAWTQCATREGTVIYGDEGTLVLGADPDRLEIFSRRHPLGDRPGWWQLAIPPTPRNAAHRHFVDCILAGERPLGTPEHARHVVEIMLAAARSSETGQRIALETTFGG